METFLQVENLTKSYGDRLLFADISFGVAEGDKIGLIAQNGKGKSTLLNIIAGNEDYDSGSIVFRDGIRVGFLAQTPPFNPDAGIEDYMADIEHAADDWTFVDRVKGMLTQFGISDLGRKMHTLSGGQIKRIALAKVLMAEPDMLILDEPTNHLDIEMIEWLENFLSRKRITLLMVTHDRYFLDKICNKIIEIDRETIFTYRGNYDYYLAKREERMQNLSAELQKVKNLLRTELEWMRRQPQARGSKAKYRIDNFHELEKKSQVRLDRKDVSLEMKSSYIGNKIFEAKEVSKSYGDKVILKDWSYNFARYDKVGIVGANGVGKSTFIKLLQGIVSPDSGRFDVGDTVRWGYYSQEGIEFDTQKKVIDAIKEIAEVVRIDEKTTLTASQFLCHFLFEPADQQKFIYKLSGGERRRLYLASVLMRSPNFLILDEPTNDLDIVTLSVLEAYLIKFKGCVIIISHDRFFLDRIVDHLFVFEGNGAVRDFPGDYSTYRHCVAQQEREPRAASAPKTEATTVKPRLNTKKPTLSYKEKKELEALEAELPLLEARKAALEAEMSSGTMTADEIVSAGKEMERLIADIDEKEMRTLELMEKL